MTAVATEPRKKKKKKKRKLSPEEARALRARHLADAAKAVQEKYRGLRLTISQMPYSRTFTEDQKRTALKDFSGASTDCVCMSKKLFDADEPAVKRVRKVVSEIINAYKDRRYTFPHPERGIRLIKEGIYDESDPEVEQGIKKAGDPGKYLDRLVTKFEKLRDDLHQAAVALEAEMPAIRERERERQKDLYDPSNYQFNASEAYKVHWSFVETGVPNYLLRLDPKLVEEATRQVQAQHMEACRMKEQEMAEMLFLALDHLIEKLSGKDNRGKDKIFKDKTAIKLLGFIDEADEQLKENGIGRGPLSRAFQRLKEIVGGEDETTLPNRLRTSPAFRDLVREGMQTVAESVLQHAVVRPKRRLLQNRAISAALHTDGKQ